MQVMIETTQEEYPPEWRRKHLSTIGASNAGAAIGKGRFKTSRKLWDQMSSVLIGGVIPPALEPSDDMRRGSILEPLARTLMAEAVGASIEHHHQDNFLTVPRYPWAHALPDGWLGSRPVELKVPRPQTIYRCNLKGLVEEWWIQGQHTLAITGADVEHFGLLDPVSLRLHRFDVEREPAYIEHLMEAEHLFMDRIMNGQPPDEGEIAPDEAVDGKVLLDSPEAKAIARAFSQLRALEKESKDSKELAKDKLRKLSGDAPCFEVKGVLRVYDKVSAASKSLDKDGVLAKHPDIANDPTCWKTKKGGRTFKAYDLETTNE